ncbi:Olfactory Receptor 9I1 [Manis pentadactyla]|nr:Olfactory Receptor 9I1 [Manis pentadactyla]
MMILIQLDVQLHTPMYFLLSHLSLLDACYTSVITPQILATLVTSKMVISYGQCAVQFFFFTVCAGTECFLLAAMAYDRYVAISNPLLYTVAMNPRICWSLVGGAYVCDLQKITVHTKHSYPIINLQDLSFTLFRVNVCFVLNFLGLRFAVSQAKTDPAFLPNITMGLKVYDYCISGTQSLRSTLALLSHQPQTTSNFSCGPRQLLLGVVGDMTSPESRPMAELLSCTESLSEGESISITATATASRPAATVIICDRYHFHFRLLPETLWENNVTSRIWIFCASFTYSPSVLSPEALDLLNGSLSLTIHSGIMPSFEDFLLALRLAMYPGKSGAQMGENSPMMWRKHPLPALLLSGSFLPPFSLPQVLHYTQKVCFTTRAHEEVLFTKDGEIPATFDIYVLPDQSGQTTIVGHFDFRAPPGKELLITDSAVTWAE